jgi:hypothetical protein
MTVVMPHLTHGGGGGWNCSGMTHGSLNSGGSATSLSATDAWLTAAAGDEMRLSFVVGGVVASGGAIVDVEATPARTYDEVAATRSEHTAYFLPIRRSLPIKPPMMIAPSRSGSPRLLDRGVQSRSRFA